MTRLGASAGHRGPERAGQGKLVSPTRRRQARGPGTLRLLFLLKVRPERLKSDNGPEFIVKAVMKRLQEQGVGPIHIEPGSPWQNGLVESFHATLRQECLDAEVFANGRQARQVVEDWRYYYNNERLHSALGHKTPIEYAAQTINNTEPILSS